MNRSYEHWENQFLDDMAIKYGFDNNHYLAFKQKLLLENVTLSNAELLTKIDNEQGGNNYFPSNMIADSWSDEIYPTLEKHGFQEKRSVKNVRKWLRFDVFPEYIKNIKPETTIELWQELWTQGENSPNHSLQIIIAIQKSSSEIQLPHLGIAVKGQWEPNPQPDCQSFALGNKINYQFILNNSGYLIVTEKFASGEIYCLSPSNLSPDFPASWGTLVLPKGDVFTVQEPIGYEEILAIFSQDKPQLEWLPQPQDDPLELQTKHLADLLNHVQQKQCEMMRYKYLITT